MSLQQSIKEQTKEAMKAKDQTRLAVLRGISTAVMNDLVAGGKTPQDEMDDEGVLVIIKREAKRRKDSIQQFTDGGRPELAANEQAELVILEEFLPEMMSLDQIRPVVIAKKEELGITDKTGMGQLMGAVMKELQGNADGGDVKIAVEEALA
jgi:uncharacterized protein YqeY